MNYPIRIARYELVADSGSDGEFRGGLGVRRDFEFPYADCASMRMTDGRKFAPWGLAGGGDCACARYILDPEGEARELPSKITLTIAEGDASVSVRRAAAASATQRGVIAPRAPPIASRAMSRVQILQGSEAT